MPGFGRRAAAASSFAERNVVVKLREDRAVSSLVVTTTKEDGRVSHYRNIRWFARRDNRWLLEYWFNDDITDLADIVAAYE